MVCSVTVSDQPNFATTLIQQQIAAHYSLHLTRVRQLQVQRRNTLNTTVNLVIALKDPLSKGFN